MTGIKEESGHLNGQQSQHPGGQGPRSRGVDQGIAGGKRTSQRALRRTGSPKRRTRGCQPPLDLAKYEKTRHVESAEVYEQKRKEIEDKVGDLLQKLEAMG